MKITLCGSIAFSNEVLAVKKELECLGYEVKLWPYQVQGENGESVPVLDFYKIRRTASDSEKWVWDRKAEAISDHFDKVAWADAILVANYDKNNIKGYVGGNTLMEIELAFFLKKKIYLLNQIPELPYKEEILGVRPIVLEGDLTRINKE